MNEEHKLSLEPRAICLAPDSQWQQLCFTKGTTTQFTNHSYEKLTPNSLRIIPLALGLIFALNTARRPQRGTGTAAPSTSTAKAITPRPPA